MEPVQERREPCLQSLLVLLHADPVHSRGLPVLQLLERIQQHLPVHVREQVVERLLPMRPSPLPDACQPEFHRGPVPVYGRCPFDTQWWRHRLPSTRVTRLHRYYSVIRLPGAVCLARFFNSLRPTPSRKSALDLPGYRHDTLSSSNRPSTPGAPTPLAATRRRMLPTVLKITSARSVRNKISGLNTFTGWGPPSTIGPRSLSYLRINAAVAVRAARLDTGPVASRYPGGILPRLSRRPCQVASFNALFDGGMLCSARPSQMRSCELTRRCPASFPQGSYSARHDCQPGSGANRGRKNKNASDESNRVSGVRCVVQDPNNHLLEHANRGFDPKVSHQDSRPPRPDQIPRCPRTPSNAYEHVGPCHALPQ